MFIEIHPQNPQPRLIKQVVECLLDGGVIIYPTDTVYGLGCEIFQKKAVEKICRIKQIEPEKAQLSFICKDLSHLADYTKSIDTPLYRTLKKYLPGPYTFILPANKTVPKILHNKKSTIGLRIPNENISQAILRELTHPILSTSLPTENDIIISDPEEINESFGHLVDIVVSGGNSGLQPSTIIDCTQDEWLVTRQGLGVWEG